MVTKKFYRGLHGAGNKGADMLRDAKKGDRIVPDGSYAFISKSRKVADDFARYINGEPSENSVVMEIILPPGSKISKNPFHLKEAVLPRNAEFEILDKTESDGVVNVLAKYIPGSGIK